MNNKQWQLFLGVLVGVLAGAALTAALGGGLHLDGVRPFQILAAVVATPLVVFLIFRKLAQVAANVMGGQSNVNNLLPAFAPTGRQSGLAEEEAVADLVLELRAGPSLESRPLPRSLSPFASQIPAAPGDNDPTHSRDLLKEFFDWAPEQVARMRKLIQKTGRVASPADTREILVEISEQITVFKLRSGLLELQPAWQLATTLEGLLKQLTGRASNINHSTLRTISGALDLLVELSVPGVRPDLAVNPAIRILAVDDDSVSRFALSAAVKKVFNQPDLAETAVEALNKVKLQRFDLIVLDVVLPDMDGFELCMKIKDTQPNGSTPILFVTSLKDFDSRSKSLNFVGTDLLGKPFMTFEIAVKTLTLTLASRLRDRNRLLEATGGLAARGTPAVGWPTLPAAPASGKAAAPATEFLAKPDAVKSDAGVIPPGPLPPPVFAVTTPDSKASSTSTASLARALSGEFLAYLATSVAELKKEIKTIGESDDEPKRLGMLAQLYLRFQCLARKIAVPELRPATALSIALEGLFKKFVANPKNATASALDSAVSGLEMLNELCAGGVKPNLAEDPPMRILVVDDEPLARRAVLGALQMAFARPDSTESGETALALAAEKEFDVVFMDVCMPGMDGFTTCTRIRETPLNRATPVVFVTSYSDEPFRTQAVNCGGNDFVVKPFAFAEITVKALTFALRGRLSKLKNPEPPKTNPPI